jgi:hypothetical protein
VKKLLSYWPVWVFLLSGLAHTDIAIVARPVLQHRLGITLVVFTVCLLVFSSLQLWYEYWFYGWCRRVAITDVWAWLTDGVWDWCKAHGFGPPIRQIGSALQVLRDGWNGMTINGWLKRRRRVMKGTSYTALFALSVSPIPGIRGPAVAVCGVMHLRWGLALLLVGNALRNLYLVLGLRWILAH